MLQARQSSDVETSELLSGMMSVSARATETPFATTKGNNVSEIEVKDMQSPITLKIPLSTPVRDPDNTNCMYLDE